MLEDVQPQNIHRVLVNIFNDIIDRISEDMDINDRIRVVFQHPALERPIDLPMMRRGDLDAEQIIA